MVKWRPIESAPKDGTHVIVATDNAVGEARYYDGDGDGHDGWYWNDEHWTDAYGGDLIYPTHWMPMPEPPIP